MSINRQGGYMNTLLIPLIVCAVLVLGLAGFSMWAFSSRQTYKNHSDVKAVAAAQDAIRQVQALDAVKYAEEAKSPLKSFAGPAQFGSVVLKYPKTWSGYIIENGNTPLDAYFHPDTVPDINSNGSVFSLRVQIINAPYSQQLGSYSSSVQQKRLTAAPFSFAKVPGVVGTRLDGQIDNDQQGSIIIVPMRNVTLQITTQSQDYVPDFNNTILPNLTFSP